MTTPITKTHSITINIYNTDGFSIRAIIDVPDDRDEEEYLDEVMSRFENVSFLNWEYA